MATRKGVRRAEVFYRNLERGVRLKAEKIHNNNNSIYLNTIKKFSKADVVVYIAMKLTTS